MSFDALPKLIEHVWTTTQPSRIYDRRLYTDGQVVFQEGDPGTKAFMVRSGAIRITKRRLGERKTLADLGPNQVFGELALIDDQPRSTTAVVLGAADLLVVDGARFRERFAGQSRYMQHWIKMLTDRLRDLSARVQD